MTYEKQQQYCDVAVKLLHEAITSVICKAAEYEMNANVLFWYFSTFVDEQADEVWDEVQEVMSK